MFFRDKYSFLSNFAYVPTGIYYNGIRFNTVENAFQAAKCKSKQEMYRFVNISPVNAKKLGRFVILRDDWDSIKLKVMQDLLSQKFEYREFACKLKGTGDIYIVEENYWHDNFWGGCKCSRCSGKINPKEQNHLGTLLMRTRSQIKSQIPTPEMDKEPYIR